MTQDDDQTGQRTGQEQAPPPVVCHGPGISDAINPFLVSVPHSGRHYPDDLLARTSLPVTTLRSSEDAFVDQLSADVVDLGVSQIVATHARAYVDLNRNDRELEADLFSPRLTDTRLDASLRVKAGLGVVPSVVGPGMRIYEAPLPARTAQERLSAVYAPYHAMLDDHIEARLKTFGHVIVLDLHSMPSAPSKSRSPWPEIVLGDCWGSSCGRSLTSQAESQFIRAGFSVRRNVPYAGGFACQHYGDPARGVHVLQVEINRALYMDESAITPLSTFDEVKTRLMQVLTALITGRTGLALAAE